MKKDWIEMLGGEIYKIDEFEGSYVEALGMNADFMAEVIIVESCNKLARLFLKDPVKFKKNKWSPQAVADLFNEAMPIKDFDWLRAMGGYNRNWLTNWTRPAGQKLGSFSMQNEYIEIYDAITGTEQSMTSKDRFSFNKIIVNAILEDDIWDLKNSYTKRVKPNSHIGTNLITKVMDNDRNNLTSLIKDKATSYKPMFEKVEIESEWEDSDDEFTWEHIDDSTIRGIFIEPRAHITQAPREFSNIELEHIKQLVRHSRTVKITALKDEDINKQNVDLTEAKERWLSDELTKYKKLKG